MVDLSSIMNKPASEVEPPKTLPTGMYLAQVEKLGDLREVGEKKTPAMDVTLLVTQPLDVALPPDIELPMQIRHTLWFSDQSLFMTVEFLEKTLGIERSGKSVGQMLQEATGRMLRVEVVEKSYTPRDSDTPRMINNVGKTFPLE